MPLKTRLWCQKTKVFRILGFNEDIIIIAYMTWVGSNDVVLLSKCSHTPLPLITMSPHSNLTVQELTIICLTQKFCSYFLKIRRDSTVMCQLVDISLNFSQLGKLKMVLLQASYSAIYQGFELFKDMSNGHQRTITWREIRMRLSAC